MRISSRGPRLEKGRQQQEGSKGGQAWEGPYRITSILGNGTYRLEDNEGKALPRPWNTCNLKFFLS